LHVVAVPDRLEERVREAEDEKVLHRLLPEVVIDAEDLRLAEHLVQGRIERPRRREVAAERLLDDDARASGAARAPEPADDRREQARRDGEVVQRMLRAAELPAEPLHRVGVAVLAAHVAQALAQVRERRRVEPPVPLDALPGARPELLERPLRPRHADDGHVETAAPGHGLEGREDLLVDEVAARPEDDERVRAGRRHEPAPFSTWPPNSNRRAETRRSWKSASPLEAKRSKSAAASTGAGTASSTAASSVQRPSPESDTRPVNRPSSGSLANAAAVRSRSHEATTLPRRQTSVIAARSKSYR